MPKRTAPSTPTEPPPAITTANTLTFRIRELVQACFSGIWITSREPAEQKAT